MATPTVHFPFPLDPFQLDAMASLDRGHSVVVCAPTGSGKTVVGEYAIHLALSQGKRVFYTTPLKALSNQKFRDFAAAFGDEQVGLLTGDVTIRPEAAVVVMTTEVFRNMLYEVGRTHPRLLDVRFVVLDECHYINDAGRGTVWEESIIRAAPAIQLVALSATIANAEELTAWIARAHGPTDLVLTHHRPVPLRVHFFHRGQLVPLVNKSGRPAFTASGRRGSGTRALEPVTQPTRVIARLQDANMLPAIYFIFSRRGCEAALERAARLSLLTPEQEEAVERIVRPAVSANPFVRNHPHLSYLRQGLAAHHAGLLPAWKGLVERLFQAGLIKVVFATETLAAGINMPARTTVISALSKRGDEGYRSLTASEFLQMSGRAGRRGMDPVGHVVVLPDPYRSPLDAARLATAPPDPLISRFTPTYGLVLGLLRTHTPAEAEQLLRQSFGQFQAERQAQAGGRRRRGRRDEGDIPTPAPDASVRSVYWREFQAQQRVLEEFGYVKDDTPTAKGLTAAALRVENALFVAEALQALDGAQMAPSVLAAVASGLATDDVRPGLWVNAPISKETRLALVAVSRVGARVWRAQRRRGVEIPARLTEIVCPLTEIWAEAATWSDITRATDMDEGSIVQMMRRALDLLRQIPEAPGLPDVLVALAADAARAIDRPPVSDVL